jgi:polar amino acid transport system ATP-binding protein
VEELGRAPGIEGGVAAGRARLVVAIIGPSGSGKSTLLRCINLLEEPDPGYIRVGGREMRFGDGICNRHSDRELSVFRAVTGLVFQHFNLFPHGDGARRRHGRATRRQELGQARGASRRWRSTCQGSGFADKGEAYPSHLSGRQRQRVALARALAMNPR